MIDWEKANHQAKHQFSSYYCSACKQKKPCQLFDREYCCSCFCHQEREKAQEYSSYEKVLEDKQKEQEAKIKQLKLLRDYSGCSQCESKQVDAFELYENNKLICHPFLMKKEGGSSSPISFSGQSKWYKKFWKIELSEWLDNYGHLPINAECARKWLKDKQHLNNCACLKEKAQEIYELFASSLKEIEEKLKECVCESSPKPRTPYYDWKNYGYTYCEKCETTIKGAGKMGVIKNRNDPKFWGLEVKERVLCGDCLEVRKGEMSPSKRAEFNRYRKLGRL